METFDPETLMNEYCLRLTQAENERRAQRAEANLKRAEAERKRMRLVMMLGWLYTLRLFIVH